MPQGDAGAFILAGKIVGIHGLRGDLKVRPLSGETTALDTVTTVYLQENGGPLAKTVQRAARHKGNILLRLAGIDNADQAQLLIGNDLLMARSDLKELSDDEYYWFELQGLTVVDVRRGSIGTLRDLFSTPAHDIYVVDGPHGEVLIPAVDAFVLGIDRESRSMQVDLPDGLVPGEVD